MPTHLFDDGSIVTKSCWLSTCVRYMLDITSISYKQRFAAQPRSCSRRVCTCVRVIFSKKKKDCMSSLLASFVYMVEKINAYDQNIFQPGSPS